MLKCEGSLRLKIRMTFSSFSKHGLTPRLQPYFGHYVAFFPRKIPPKICQFILGLKMTPHFWK